MNINIDPGLICEHSDKYSQFLPENLNLQLRVMDCCAVACHDTYCVDSGTMQFVQL